jgi:membrane peptidoglycan carboxypeptidase
MAKFQQSYRKKITKPWFFKRKGFWGIFFLLGLVGIVGGWIGADEYTKEFRKRAATYDLDRINELEEPSIILDRNGKEIGRIFVQNRSVIPIEQVPEIFIQALRAGEDSRFLTHHGVDYIGIGRAMILNAKGGNQGASTITQQLARNAYNLKDEAILRKETKMQRKLVEAFLARRIEDRYSKRQILNFYINRIYFGSGFYGLRSASLGYFGKEPLELTLGECASLVTLIKNPNGRSPLNNPEINRNGRNYVLGRMRDEGMISSSDVARLKVLPLGLNSQPLRRGTSHLYERVAEAVGAALGEDALASGKFKIHTTILAEAQNAAQKALFDSLAQAEARPGYAHPKYQDYRKNSTKPAEYLQGAVLMIDHDTGEVLAHVGGRDYSQVPFDFIELGKRPLGTAFFPYIYAAGLSGSQTPATLIEDEPMDNRAVMIGGREGILGEWGMEISSPTYEGKIPARNRAVRRIGRLATRRRYQRRLRPADAEGRAAASPRGWFRGGFHETSGESDDRLSAWRSLWAGGAGLLGPDRKLGRTRRLPPHPWHRQDPASHGRRYRLAGPQSDGGLAFSRQLQGGAGGDG